MKMAILKKTMVSGLTVVASIALAASAHAASIIGLYDTGVDASGNVLAAGSGEMHYKVVAVGNAAPGTLANTIQALLPLAPKVTSSTSWSPNSAVGSGGSAWITPLVNGTNAPVSSGSLLPIGSPPATARTYDYELKFNLGTLSAASAMLSGDLQADNFARVLLNGTDIGGQPPVNSPGVVGYFRKFTAFGANGGFLNGENTLTFRVYDYGIITGLRVSNLVGSAVPEPATWGLMLSGFFLVATQMRRRRQSGRVVTA